MKSLIINGYGVKISYKKGVLVISKGKESSKYSLADIDKVVLVTSGISITTKAIRALIDSGIDLIIMDSKGMPTAMVHHPFISRTVETRRAQYKAFNDYKAVVVVKVIAVSKILNQAGLLKRLSRSVGTSNLRDDIKLIKSYADEVMSIDGDNVKEVRPEVMKLEAAAARIYWSAYAYLLPKDLGFNGRDQDGVDVVNKSLNYGYGILYSECWKATVLAGLDPYAGFLHSDRSGKPVLVFDIVEVFRAAAIDYPLLKAFRRGWRPNVDEGLLSSESRVELIKLVNESLSTRFKAGSQVKELRSWISTFTHILASYLKDRAILKPLVFRW